MATRRQFLKTSGALAAVLALNASFGSGAPASAQAPTAGLAGIFGGGAPLGGQTPTPDVNGLPYLLKRRVTQADRKAAAARYKALSKAAKGKSLRGAALVTNPATGYYIPDYFGTTPNWAFSPALPKFVAPLPNIPIAVPDTITFPGSDYYEISLRQYSQVMHPSLPPTTLRGYVQTNMGTDANGQNTVAPPPIQYLGPLIVARRDRPVRIKFTNELPTGAAGNLFIPVDTTYMGAGMGPTGANYTQNRAVVHLHGGTTPWISDGTPHQWITPAGESTPYTKGVSTQNVPDMWFDPVTHAVVPAGTPGATNDPGPGSVTLYYTNQQSARLMFYHDHAYGITRLNVYVGEAAGYLLTDTVEQDLINGTNTSGANPGLLRVLPDIGIPLIIQDRTFVDDATILTTDPTWSWGTNPGKPQATPVKGDLWYPHVYMPNQNPYDVTGANMMGR